LYLAGSSSPGIPCCGDFMPRQTIHAVLQPVFPYALGITLALWPPLFISI
jgi:hypothetical protein